MNSLQKAAKEYKNICEHTYKYTFNNGEEIIVCFRPQNFCHLAGLRKFSDLREFQYENGIPVFSAKRIFQKALAGEFSDYYIQASIAYTQESKERIERLAYLSELLKTKTAVFGFNTNRAPIVSRIKSNIILFNNEGYNFYLLLGLSENGKYYYPETFFLRFDDAYVRGQNIVLVKKFEIL